MRRHGISLAIRTPEGVTFSLALAGPVSRLLAYSVDLACVFAATSLLGTLLTAVFPFSPSVVLALFILLYFAVTLGYGIALEWFWRGQTLGKRVLRLRVMDSGGLRLCFSQVVLRNLLRAVDALPAFYLTGGAACLLSPRCQRLGDLAAGTVVVREPRLSRPDTTQLLAGRYNSLRDCPHACARLRQAVTPGQAAAALQALLRREELEPHARLDLFANLAQGLRALAPFPEEAVENLTPEQFVRSAVDVLYRVK